MNCESINEVTIKLLWTQGLSYHIETGCPKLAISKYRGRPSFQGRQQHIQITPTRHVGESGEVGSISSIALNNRRFSKTPTLLYQVLMFPWQQQVVTKQVSKKVVKAFGIG